MQHNSMTRHAERVFLIKFELSGESTSAGAYNNVFWPRFTSLGLVSFSCFLNGKFDFKLLCTSSSKFIFKRNVLAQTFIYLFQSCVRLNRGNFTDATVASIIVDEKPSTEHWKTFPRTIETSYNNPIALSSLGISTS